MAMGFTCGQDAFNSGLKPEAPPSPPPEELAPEAAGAPVSAPSGVSIEAIPPLLGRYRLTQYLDSGGTADVFRAVDLSNHSTVAVKILNETARHDARLRRYFLEGSRAAQRVSHPNLLRLLAVHEPADFPPFAVMELLSGRALSSLLPEGEVLPVDLSVELARQAASGLEAAHLQRVVHCDVKPENLLIADLATQEIDGDLDGAGLGFRVSAALKVIDFDLASLGADGTEGHEHPLLRGTAKYMAPEQVVGDPVDARTDIYALGVVLFRMLTGHLPFDLRLSPTLLWHQLASPAPPPSWLREDLDPALEAIVLKALCKAPENRYQTMGGLIDDLRAYQAGGRVVAHSGPRARDSYVPRTGAAVEAARTIVASVSA